MSCFGCENKNGGHFFRSKTEELGEIIVKTWQEQQEDNSKGDICYLENICRAEQPETCTIEDELNIDLIDGGKHVELCS